MDYRNGKCSSCGAEYKIPTSFAHDVAKCKKCSGVVRIEPAQAAAAPSAPVPAKRVQKRPVTSGTVTSSTGAVETSGAADKRKERGTLAKLRAQRAVDEAEEAPAAQAKPRASAARSKPARSKPEPVTAKGGTLAARTRKSSGKKLGGEGDEGFSSRRGSRDRHKQGLPMGGMIAIGALVLLLAAGGLYFGGIIGGGDEVEAGETAQAPVEDTTPLEDEAPEEEAPDEEPAAEEAPAEPKVKLPPNPDDIKLDEIEDFGPARGTTDEEWTEITGLVATFMDLDAGAKGPRAGRKLEEIGRKAFPAIINHMKTLDFSTEQGFRKGDMSQKTLEKILNGQNYGWKYETEENYVWFDKKVVELYAKSWRQVVTDVKAWINLAKLEDKDPNEAMRLLQEFGSGVGGAGGDDFGDDDLDVD